MTVHHQLDWRNGKSANDLPLADAGDYSGTLIQAADRVQLVTRPRRQGSYACKFTVKQNDYDNNGSTDRAQLFNSLPKMSPGDTYYLACSVYIPQDYIFPASGKFHQLRQMFGITGGQTTGSPPFALEISPAGNFIMVVRGGVKATAADTAPRTTSQTIAPVHHGCWHDFLFEVVLSTSASGTVKCYYALDGASLPAAGSPTVTDTGINVLTVGGIDQLVFPEFGHYRSTVATDNSYFDGGSIIASTRAEAEALFTGTRLGALPSRPVTPVGRTTQDTALSVAANTDNVRLQRFVMPEAGWVTKASMFGAGQVGTNQALKAVIYADSAGSPGALLGSGSEFTVVGATADQWFESTMGLLLPAGAFWGGFHSGNRGSSSTKIYCKSVAANVHLSGTDTYTDGPTSPYAPTAPSSTVGIEMDWYLTYRPAAREMGDEVDDRLL